MATFPDTSATLIARIRDISPGQDDVNWNRLWNIYSGPVRAFVSAKGGAENTDDIVMQVFGKLVDALREGKFDPAKGNFHSYLASMICNEIKMQRRRDVVRKKDDHVSIDATQEDMLQTKGQMPGDDWEEWHRAILVAAREHVMHKTALSKRDRSLYSFYVCGGHSLDETVARFGLTRNNVSKIKSRIEQRIVQIAREMASALGG